MRYQSRSYRSQSFLMVNNKENKENADVNLGLPKGHKLPDVPKALGKIERRISDVTTNISNTSMLKKDHLTQHLKDTYSEMVAQEYSEDIMDVLCQKSIRAQGFLSHHGITATLRSKMVDWMIEVLSSYKMSQDTFFRSVMMMDYYLKNSNIRQEVKDLHLIGVTSMFSAAKYEEIHPFKMSVIYDKISRRKFRKMEILQKQSQIIASLGFNLEQPTLYEIIKHITHQINLVLTISLQKYFLDILLYLCKMSLFSYQLAEENPSLLAAAVYFIGLKTLEQVESVVQPQKTLNFVLDLLCLKESIVIDISRKVLQLAKNFSRIYPNLSNLKKFNKFEYKKSAFEN